jgi:hypothetical protein
MKNRDEELAKQIQVLKQKLEEVEQLARGRGLGGSFHFRHGHATEDGNGKPAWSLQKSSRKISSLEELTSLIYSVSLLLARESNFLVPIYYLCWLNHRSLRINPASVPIGFSSFLFASAES